MGQATATSFEFDPAIRADAELMRDLQAANDYLDTLHGPVPKPAVVRWELAREQPGLPEHRPAVVVVMRDFDKYDGFVAESHPLSRVRTRSRDVRERAVGRTWTDILRNRSRTMLERVGAALDEIERGGGDGGGE